MTYRDANSPLVASTRLLAAGESTDYHLTDTSSLQIGEGVPENTNVEAEQPPAYEPPPLDQQPQPGAAPPA